ncbi:MAG: cytochrome P450 [Pirellulaceae bacterium]|nr:cytochrome P450 [Pirellulaceae bacterium]
MSGNEPASPMPAGGLLGDLRALRADVLRFLETVPRQRGDVAPLRLAWYRAVLLSHPEHVHQVLVTDCARFQKPPRFRRAARRICGRGLFANEGPDWRRQRQRVQAALQRLDLDQYAGTVNSVVDQTLAGWPRDGDQEMFGLLVRLALAIRASTTFGTRSALPLTDLAQATSVFMDYFVHTFRWPLAWPLWVPTGRNRRTRAACRTWWRTLRQAIEVAGTKNHSVESLLDALQHPDTEADRLTSRQLLDELATWVLTGTETLANTLAWSCYLLARHPAARRCLADELDRTLGGRPPMPADVARLPYLESVIRETLRLFPQGYMLGRKALEPFSVGRQAFPSGTAVILNQWFISRDSRWFDDPLAFEPRRWSDGLLERLPRGAFIPYGAGPRACAGRMFARIELPLVLAAITQRFDLELSPERAVRPLPSITLRPSPALPIRLRQRAQVPNSGAGGDT